MGNHGKLTLVNTIITDDGHMDSNAFFSLKMDFKQKKRLSRNDQCHAHYLDKVVNKVTGPFKDKITTGLRRSKN